MDTLDHSQQQALLIRSDIPTRRNVFLGSCLVIVLALLPVYAFSSGGFQLVDIPILFIIIVTLIINTTGNDKGLNNHIIYLIPFVAWALLVNGIYFIIYENNWFLLGSVPIVYAIFLLNAFYIIFTRLIVGNGIKYIYIGIILSIACCFTFKGYTEEGRATLSFNDPNQLGYFAVFLLSYVVILKNYIEKLEVNRTIYNYLDIIIIIAAHYFLFLSVSRSTMAAFILLDLCFLKNIRNAGQIFTMFLAIFLMAGFVFFLRPTFIQERMATRQDHFDRKNMAENLKMRLFLPFATFNGTDILFGRGTGWRNDDSNIPGIKSREIIMEVHNMFGEVLRAFGLIGLSLFLFWLIKFMLCVRGVKDSFWVLAGIFTFNMSINGIRWRAFWIFLAFLLAMAALYKEDHEPA